MAIWAKAYEALTIIPIYAQRTLTPNHSTPTWLDASAIARIAHIVRGLCWRPHRERHQTAKGRCTRPARCFMPARDWEEANKKATTRQAEKELQHLPHNASYSGSVFALCKPQPPHQAAHSIPAAWKRCVIGGHQYISWPDEGVCCDCDPRQVGWPKEASRLNVSPVPII